MPMEQNAYLPPIRFSAQADTRDLAIMLHGHYYAVETRDGRQAVGPIVAILDDSDDDPRCPPGEDAVVIRDESTGEEVAFVLVEVEHFVYL